MDKVNEEFWYNQWHKDIELHQQISIKDVTQISKDESVSIYADTDSVCSQSLVKTDSGEFTIEDWYNNNLKNGSGGVTTRGHESVLTDDKILNFDSNKGIYYAPVKRIIRHKVSKPKWKLKTKSGKEVIVTNDHSMIVFRNGNLIELKPSEILKTDKILIVKADY